METATIARLLQPFAELSTLQLQSISIYVDILLRWNARINLTGLRTPQDIVVRHFGESFFAASKMITPDWKGRIVDLGSGAGFPGLPMALWAPNTEVILIESSGKKGAFLNEVIRALRISNAQVFKERAEAYDSTAELVTMRAVEKFERALLEASRLIEDGGRLGLMVGAGQVKAAKGILSEFRWQEPISTPSGHSRELLIGTKRIKVE
ncbi:MAG: 16S rRNA (guanine(527)-N(7))-methyltransferase RsmG [Candidatus Angelobacter sp.]